ncbi:MAG: stage II sporulation protein R [Oscillospiraceae bacterium]|nr:stage II sporulation protein R [Oscillospiraceae bacterium]
MKKHIFELVIIFVLASILSLGAFANDTQKSISEKMVRLHVIANSDSESDQAVKLKVRDAILEEVANLTEDCKDIAEVQKKISENLPRLTAVAENTLSENGFNYGAEAELAKTFFPSKYYDGFALPAGEYNALRIKLGEASGKNWWCVLFPPLCISAAEEPAEIQLSESGLSDDEIKLVTSDEIEYKYKFKIVEFFQNLFR